MRTVGENDQELARVLEVLQHQPARNPKKVESGRALFLSEAQRIAESTAEAVSAPQKLRHMNWMQAIQSFFMMHRKERSPMFSTLGTLLLVISLVLGGSGITVAAAQLSLPDDTLYPVKTLSENVRVRLANTDRTRFQLALEFADRRAEEMQTMLRAGETTPAAIQERLQAEINLAFQLAARQPDQEMVQSLEQIREQLREQEQAFLRLGPQPIQKNEALIEQTRIMLHERLQLCQDGIQDPVFGREQIRERNSNYENAPKISPEIQPLKTNTGNPWTTETPPPGSGYGPGQGDDKGAGNNPWTDETPIPENGYGPGPEKSSTPGNSFGPGPGQQSEPTQSGNNGDGGNSDGDNGNDSGSGDQGNGGGNSGGGGDKGH